MPVALRKVDLDKPDIDTVSTAAVDALRSSGGDTAKALKVMADRVRNNRALRDALLDPLVEYACSNAIQALIRHNRSKVWNADATRPGLSNVQRVAALAAGNLLMFPLPIGGKPLSQATREDVSRNAEFYETQARDMSHKGRWLRLIAQSLPGGKTVSQALNEDRLRELQQEAARD